MPRAARPRKPVAAPPASHAATVAALRKVILQAVPGAEEDVKWNAPNFSLGGADFATLNLAAKDRVRLVLHLGANRRAPARRAVIPDPAALLEWRGTDRAIASFMTAADVTKHRASLRESLGAWVRQLTDGAPTR